MNKNIVLIGMMGSGKSTLGRALAQALQMDFVDMDDYIEESWEPIPDLFEKGESTFRDIESEAAKQLSMTTNQVIATGGGVILRVENMTHLKRNGLIVFIDRPLDVLLQSVDTGHRPLLKEGRHRLISLYNDRIDRYKQYAGVTLVNNADEDTALKQLIKVIEEAEG